MSKKVKIVLNSPGIDALLHSEGITAELLKAAQIVQGNAGDDFEAIPMSMPTRNIVRVQSANARGEQRNRDENTLLKSLHGGGEND